jgi:hypothetical protein
LLLDARAQDDAEDQRQDRKAETPHHEAQRAERQQEHQVKRLQVHRVGAQGGEEQDAGVQVRARDLQELRPHRCQRQVDQQQQQVADEEAGDQRPHQGALAREELGTGLDAVAGERCEHHRGGGVGGQAQGKHGGQGAGSCSVVGSFRTGHAFDGALAELLGVLAEALLGDVGEERGDLGAAGGQCTEGEAVGGPAEPGLPGPLPVLLTHPRAAHGNDLQGVAAQVGGHPEGFTDGEDRHRHHHNVQAVGQERHAEREPGLARDHVQAYQADGEAKAQRCEAAKAGGTEDRGDGQQGQHHDREVARRAQADGEFHHDRGADCQEGGTDGAGNEGADGRRRKRLCRTPRLGHFVAFDRRHHRRRLARCVQQDRGGGAAVHAAVVDAGEHNEGAGGFQGVGDREQQGNGHGRAQARKDADGGAQEYADHGVEEVHGGQGGGETVHQ